MAAMAGFVVLMAAVAAAVMTAVFAVISTASPAVIAAAVVVIAAASAALAAVVVAAASAALTAAAVAARAAAALLAPFAALVIGNGIEDEPGGAQDQGQDDKAQKYLHYQGHALVFGLPLGGVAADLADALLGAGCLLGGLGENGPLHVMLGLVGL